MLIIGAGGFAFQTLEVYISSGKSLSNLLFFDNVNQEINNYISINYKILKSFDEVNETEFILGIGNPTVREFFFNKLNNEYQCKPCNLISETAIIGTINNKIKLGVSIMQGVVIMSNCRIGNGVLLNINSTIGHDSIIEDFVEICPGVHISGNCKIGKGAFIGTGAILIPKIKVGEGAVIAAGSVVIKDVPPKTLYAGNPAIFKKKIK